LVEIGQQQFGAFVAQPVSDLSPDSPGTACAEDDFAVQRCHGRQSTLSVGLGAAIGTFAPITGPPRVAHRRSNIKCGNRFSGSDG
jgi:hypothetical protein